MSDKHPVATGSMAARYGWNAPAITYDANQVEELDRLGNKRVAVISLDVYRKLAAADMVYGIEQVALESAREDVHKARAEVKQWREACAKRDAELAARDDQIAAKDREILSLRQRLSKAHLANDNEKRDMRRELAGALSVEVTTMFLTWSSVLGEVKRRLLEAEAKDDRIAELENQRDGLLASLTQATRAEATKLAEEFDRLPPPDERAEPPTFEEQVRAHAERAGYDFLSLLDGEWHVMYGKQGQLQSGDGLILGRVGLAWRRMSEDEALAFAASWPDASPRDEERTPLSELAAIAGDAANDARKYGCALDAIAVLLGLGDWDDPQQVVDAVRERVGQWVEGPPPDDGRRYWMVYDDRSVGGPHLYSDGDDLCVIAHMLVSCPRYPR